MISKNTLTLLLAMVASSAAVSPFGPYEDNPQCVGDFGFDYGWKMDGCQEGTFTLDGSGAGFEASGSCATASDISVTVTCIENDEGEAVQATISWTGGDISAVKMKGASGGQLVAPDNGGTYEVGTAKNGKLIGISHIQLCVDCDASSPPSGGGASGDPHFKTWTGEKFDYHGECDLVLVDNPTFNNGQGLKVHIRTTRIKYFSYIEKVAVQIGNDVLEFDNDVENFLINGKKVEANQKHHKTHLGGFPLRRDPKAISIRLHDVSRKAKNGHNIAKIDLHTRKNGFPAVIIASGDDETFKGSLGILGDWATGRRLARDGVTEIAIGHDGHAAEFAEEWQVLDTEPMLFTDARAPQFPVKCIPPQPHKGRLGSASMRKEAEKACAHWKEDMDDCIFDVMATRDVLVAAEGHYEHVQ